MAGSSATSISVEPGWPLYPPTIDKPVHDSVGLEKWIEKHRKNTFTSDAVVVYENFFSDKTGPDTPQRFLEVGALDGLSGSNS